MQTMDLPKNALQWETERQNRILQEAAEQKKKRMHGGEVAALHQPAESMLREVSLSRSLPENADVPMQIAGDVLRRVPEMRSALVPFDEGADEASWSKPFSLPKADMEPWLSYLNGYAQSRLFLDAASGVEPASTSRNESSIDFAVRALLELKGARANLILEPPVQINGPVEYFELEADLLECADPLQKANLLKFAGEAHENLLRQAEEKGRNMGNHLYDALMGEGHANLIKAWEKVFERKPNVEELHLMLTTGRIKVVRRRRPMPLEASVPPAEPVIAPVPESRVVPSAQSERRVARTPLPQPATMDFAAAGRVGEKSPEPGLVAARRPAAPEQPEGASGRKLLLYVFHAAVGFAALAAYGMWMFG